MHVDCVYSIQYLKNIIEARSVEHVRTKVAKRPRPKGSYIYIFICPELIEETGRFRRLIFGISGNISPPPKVEVSSFKMFTPRQSYDMISGFRKV